MTYFDQDGQPIDLDTWAELQGDVDVVHVGRWKNGMTGDVVVSTVWRGLDRERAGPPLIYETMVLGGDRDGETWRYASRVDAEVGHAEVVRVVNTAPPADPVDVLANALCKTGAMGDWSERAQTVIDLLAVHDFRVIHMPAGSPLWRHVPPVLCEPT